jgi:TolB protein
MSPAPEPAARPDSVLESTLEIMDIETGERTVVLRVRDHIEAPNWMPDGERLLYNSGGKLYTIPVAGGEPTMLETGFAERINNDHGISPDGTRLVISDGTRGDGGSRIYTLPIEGGDPVLITPEAPSYWHGWSPDGETLAYVASRGGDFDIYTIPVGGGEETRLTTAPGLDDGPDYTFDGEWIYFNSVRTGTMQIWRMRPDGADQHQVTFDERNDWFPHPSPDGRWIVFVSFGTDVAPGDHPPNKNVSLRILPIEEPGLDIDEATAPRVLVDLFGGQGTINVPSWSPDSRRFAFVSYRFVEE